MSVMGHPMHLHGHHCRVVEISRQARGAMSDTHYVPLTT